MDASQLSDLDHLPAGGRPHGLLRRLWAALPAVAPFTGALSPAAADQRRLLLGGRVITIHRSR